MLAAYTLGAADPCSDDPCSSPSCPEYSAETCGALAASPTTSSAFYDDAPGSCSTDADCSGGQTCNAASNFCESEAPPQSPSKQITPVGPQTASTGASVSAAAAAALPKLSNKMLLTLLALAGVAGAGWFAYSRMKRSPRT